MLICLLKKAYLCLLLLNITQASLHKRNDRSTEPELPKELMSGSEVDNHISNLANSLPWLEVYRIRRNAEAITSPLAEESIPDAEVPNPAIPTPSDNDEPMLKEDAQTNNDKILKKEYCLWFDNDKKKEYKIHNGTHWSGNGCKLLHCLNGMINPDPSCCRITTRKHGFSLNYTLFQNHGERTIVACEVMVCNSGKITKVKRIPGCCVHDHVESREHGEFWMAPNANMFNTEMTGKSNVITKEMIGDRNSSVHHPTDQNHQNHCKLITCNNGVIGAKLIGEDEVWGQGCTNYVCENSQFRVNKVDMPGSCMTPHGDCITNGTTVKLWNECKGLMCVNGKLFKGFLKECSWNNKVLYKAYNP